MSVTTAPRSEEKKKGFPFYLLLSCLLHAVLILLLAFLFARHFLQEKKPSVPEPSPAEVTLELPPPIPAERPMAEAKNLTDQPPENAPFQSDQNAKASSEQPPAGNLPLPTQQGITQSALELQNQKHTEGDHPARDSGNPAQQTPPSAAASSQASAPAQSAPTTPPEATPRSTPPASPQTTPPPTSLKLLELPPEKPQTELAKPAESTRPPTPSSPQSQPSGSRLPPGARKGYQQETRQTVIRGNISNRGRSSVAAEATPIGRYRKAVSDAIGSRWYFYVDREMTLLSVGTVDVSFKVDANGKPTGLHVVRGSNEALTDCSVRSIIDAKLPPIPPDVAATLQNGMLEIDYSFTIY